MHHQRPEARPNSVARLFKYQPQHKAFQVLVAKTRSLVYTLTSDAAGCTGFWAVMGSQWFAGGWDDDWWDLKIYRY